MNFLKILHEISVNMVKCSNMISEISGLEEQKLKKDYFLLD